MRPISDGEFASTVHTGRMDDKISGRTVRERQMIQRDEVGFYTWHELSQMGPKGTLNTLP